MDQDNTGTDNPLAPEGASTTNENKSETPNQTTVEPVTPTPPIVDPATPPSTPPTEPKKPKALIATTIILAILAIAGVAFGIYGMFLKPESKCEANCQDTTGDDKDTNAQPPSGQKEYALSDYVSFTQVSIPVTFPDEVEKGHTEDIVTKIELKNLPASTINKFNTTQEDMINCNAVSCENTANAVINGNIMSVHNVFKYIGTLGITGKAETLNYDLDAQKELSNEELANIYNITGEDLYTAVLQNLVHNVTANSFLLDTSGNVTAPTISISDFTNNIPEYAKTLSDNHNLLKLYVDEEDKVHALYQQFQVLEALGMSTHMGIGLLYGYQDIAR